MQNSDLLLTTAEVAAAFAGFTAVVSVFGPQASADKRHRWRIRGMIDNSLLVVCFSLFPFILGGFFDPETAWRWSSGLLGISWFVAAAFAVRRGTRVLGRSAFRDTFRETPILAGSQAVVIALGLGALFLNATGKSFGSASTMYFTGLFAPLLLSAVLFVRIVAVAVADADAES